MRLYKIDFTNTIGNNVVTVPTDSEFLIGLSNGDADATVKLYDGETEIESLEDKIGAYTVFQFTTSGTPSRKHYKGVFTKSETEGEDEEAVTTVIYNVTVDILVICQKMSVAYRDLTGETYELPVASSDTLGGVKVGSNLTISEGVLSTHAPYVLPEASAETLGGVKVGSNLTISDGVLSANGYTLPAATDSTLGGVIVGTGLAINDGVLSATGGGSYVLPAATDSTLGGIKVGSNLTISDGVLSTHAPYSLPEASSQTLGGVKVGTGLSMDANGVLSTTGLVTSISSQSTDAQYPSAKCVYDLIGDVETLINAI